MRRLRQRWWLDAVLNEQFRYLQHELPQFNVVVLQQLELLDDIIELSLCCSTITPTELPDNDDDAASCCDDSSNAGEDRLESHALQHEPGQAQTRHGEAQHYRPPRNGISPARPIQKRCNQRQNERHQEEYIGCPRVSCRDVCEHDSLPTLRTRSNIA